MKLLLIYAVGWLGLVVLAMANGAGREKLYAPRMDELSAHQLSTAVGLVLFGTYIWAFTGCFPIGDPGQALMVGALWLVMTFAFEFLFGHFVMGHSWARLLCDYHVRRGRIWVLVPVWIAVAPYLFFRLRA